MLGDPALNGIDYLEVVDRRLRAGSPRQQTLLVHCLNPVATNLTPANVISRRRERHGNHGAWVAPASDPPPQTSPAETAEFTGLADAANILVIRTSAAGDFSPYCCGWSTRREAAKIRLGDRGVRGFDPILAEVEFTFKVEWARISTAPPRPDCPPDAPAPPPINYLAKDYGSFRTILLDRLNQLPPNWGHQRGGHRGSAGRTPRVCRRQSELSPGRRGDRGLHRDARSRVSLRRHALLVDYGYTTAATPGPGCA